MVKAKAIFQPLSGQTHKKDIVKLLIQGGAVKVRIATAFANSAGVEAVKAALIANANVTRIFVGIRNGATTYQGLLALLTTGASIYVVDTGSPYRIFHPKFYIIVRDEIAHVVLGSANATHAGLHNNIEAGVILELDTTDKEDKNFLAGLLNPLTELRAKHPAHCYKVKSTKHAEQLLQDGLVEDERSPRFSVTAHKHKGSKAAALPAIALPFTAPPRPSGKKHPNIPAPPARKLPAAPPSLSVSFGDLVWEKSNLPASDLQFPGAGGNPTGVLRLSQAKFQSGGVLIDHQTYFRNIVFGKLSWNADPTAPGKEITMTTFALVVSGIFCDEHDLQLSHRPGRAAGQGNVPTTLHWGTATDHIKDKALIGHTLRLYAPANAGAPFVLEIDI